MRWVTIDDRDAVAQGGEQRPNAAEIAETQPGGSNTPRALQQQAEHFSELVRSLGQTIDMAV
jgi:hypothetical protein